MENIRLAVDDKFARKVCTYEQGLCSVLSSAAIKSFDRGGISQVDVLPEPDARSKWATE